MKKTIYDLAKELGVAPSTVSKSLSGKSGISEETRQRVIDYANEVRYFPNEIAAKLKTKKSYSIGIVFSESLGIGLEHSFFSRIIQSFKTYVEKRGYEIVFVINNLGRRSISYYEYCLQKGVDGVFIVTSIPSDKHVEDLLTSNIHCVTADNYLKNSTTVVSDNIEGARIATEFFINNGNTKIGTITGPLNSFAGKERLTGFLEVMNEHNLEVDENFIIEAEHYSYEHGYACGNTFLSYPNRPTAMFISSDVIAMGFIKCLQNNGVRVPEDVEIIGFDDVAFSKIYTPALSTIRQNTDLIGKTAAKKLLESIENGYKKTTETEYIPVELVLRESTRSKFSN